MAENNNNNRLTRMLLSKSRRAQYLRVFAVLAACVVVAVVVVLHQSGIAMTHKEQVLTCPVTDVVAHTHNESCYDKDGNLVCTLPERELHTHTDDCYTEVRELTCGQEESETHKHTDACYSVMRDLTCGKEEITEEHVHGPGCFTTVEVQDEEVAPEVEANSQQEVVASANAAMPAQEFNEKILDDKGNLWANVSVKAPEGAFPANTTMKVEPLDAESVRTKVEDALKKDNALVSGAKQMKAVDIKFFDEQGKEIEPAVEVEVKITSDTVRDIKNPVLVHVDKDEAKEAEVLKKVDVVNKNEEDKSEDTKDTLKFESNAFSPYVIVEPKVISAKVITASGDAYTVTVSYGEEAMIPSDATLSVKEIAEGKEGYDELANQTVEAVKTDSTSVENLRMFDITILDTDGNMLEPLAPVEVKIELEGNQIDEDSELKVVHFANNGTKVIDPATETKDDATDTLTFTTDSFSVYSVINWKVTNIKNGKYAIVFAGDNGNDNEGYAMRAKAAEKKVTTPIPNTNPIQYKTRYEERDDKLAAEAVTIASQNNQKTAITTSGDNSLTIWTIEKQSNGTYTIKAGDNRFLNISNEGKLFLSNQPQNLTFEVNNNYYNYYYNYYYGNYGTIKIKSGNKYIKYNDNIGDNIKAFETGDAASNLVLANIQEKLPEHTDSPNGPSEVRTVSNENITIDMFDYPGTGTGGSPHSELDQYLKEDPWNTDNTRLPTQDLASRVLQSNGYPTFIAPSGTSDGALIFDPTTAGVSGYYRGSANNLFLESEYNKQGHYYEYDSSNNFAYFDQKAQKFRVYDGLGSWETTNTTWNTGGEFYPFFDLDTTRSGNKNGKTVWGLKDSAGKKVEQADACYFGMSIKFSFFMPENGEVDGKPMRYEFSGDDDVWVYIDNVLILDIGGRHESSEGYIDFKTGEVYVREIENTTIFKRFKEARKLPDGTDWPDNDNPTILDKYFKKVNDEYATLKPSYMPHDFKMFYLEHYATASNLRVRFNLAPIPSGEVVVQKKLDDNTQEAYANKAFSFQLLESRDNGATWTAVQVDGNDTFSLKPGEHKAMKEGINLKDKIYKIKELNILPGEFPKVEVNGKEYEPDADGSVTWRPDEDHQKINVTFKNMSSETNTNNLLITKRIGNNEQTEDRFKFKILLENTAGELVPYNGGTYYITKNNKYYTVNNGTLQEESSKDQAKLTADSNGVTEAIKKDFTIVVEGIMAGTDFKVEEIGVVGEGSTEVQELSARDWESNIVPNVDTIDPGELNGSDGRIKKDVDAVVEVTNTKKVAKAKVYLKKVDNKNNLLGNAEFVLQDGNTQEDLLDGQKFIPGGTEESNPALIGELVSSDYYLKEISAPDGYTILVKGVLFRVNPDGTVKLIEVNSDGTVSLVDQTANATVGTHGQDGYVITVANTPGKELPKTGGIGTGAIYAAGAVLVGIAGFGLVSKKMRNNL